MPISLLLLQKYATAKLLVHNVHYYDKNFCQA